MEAIEHPPHVHRLLRLIRDGTTSHASRASVLLGRYAASCCAGASQPDISNASDGSGTEGNNNNIIASPTNPGLIIWDLIGRLVGGDGVTTGNTTKTSNNSGRGKRKKKKKNSRPTSGLFDSNWSTRSNSALALEYVARCLPLADRRHFFEGDDDSCITDVQDNLPNGNNATESNTENGRESNNEEEISLWLSVNDLSNSTNNNITESEGNLDNPHTQNQLDVVAERGRLLLSSSGEQYDWNCDGEVSEYIREREAMQNLDASAAQPLQQEEDDSKKTLQQSFLMRRVTLQRQILARRLGLGGILSAPIVADYGQGPEKNNAIVADEDLAPTPREQIAKKPKDKSAKQSKKRRRSAKSEPEQNMEENAPGTSIRALLVLESKRSADGINCKSNRHRNPQMLLGSELAYRTFDPDWTVRHGALLGTLALLRAWKVHEMPRLSRNDSKHKNKQHQAHRKFGKWPQDILARCVCILALDQFADFSGAACQGADDSDDMLDGISSGAIVAPVREMAAQIIAILLEASPPQVSECTHDLLVQLYTQRYNFAEQRGNNGWDIRHGVLLAWKYICAMALFYSQRQTKSHSMNGILTLRPLSTGTKPQNNDIARCRATFNNIILQSVRGLSDKSDDNQAVAAQVLRYSLLVDGSLHTIDVAKICSRPLWDAIMKIREGVSACAADLLHLLAELLSRDCTAFLSCLREMPGSFSLDSILQKLIGFIADDSIHVKISCFCALHLVAKPIARAILDGASANKSQPIDDSAATLCHLLNRLFETYFIPEYIICSDGSGGGAKSSDDQCRELFSYRNRAWSTILRSLAILTENIASPHLGIIDDTFTSLTLRYLGIYRSSIPSEDSNLHANQSYSLARINSTHGGTELATDNSYCSKLEAARALSEYCGIYATNQPAILSEKIYSILQSPWLGQCEAGYLLHTSLATSTESNGSPFFVNYLPYMAGTFDRVPTCVLLEESASSSSVLDDPSVQSICDNGLAVLLDSSESCPSEEGVLMWGKAFLQKGISFEDLRKSSINKSPTKAAMRLFASISGALVACGSKHLPSKVTPLIRALMTSLKNEESYSRRVETCRYISQLVSTLSKNPIHEKARNKLIESVCSTACERHGDASGPSKGVEYAVELLVGKMGSDEQLEDFAPIWDRLSPLLVESSLRPSDQQLSDAILMLLVISKALSKDCSSFKRVLDSFMRSATSVACTADSDHLRSQASLSITNFCRSDFCATMDMILPSLLTTLTNLQDDRGRVGGCKLLLTILHDFEVLVAPYVTTLLPVAMRLMTDAAEECSKLAASAFAILVRIAPLAASHLDKGVGESTRNESDDVIRHLILGKPLPPCILPEVISSLLRQSGTTLRPYQIEGISWLKFLAGVHLNGALCDDMGIGKTLQALVAVAISHHDKSGGSNGCAAPNNNKKSLVICPSSVVGHWMSEIKRFFPGNEVFTSFDYTGSAKTRRAAWQDGVHQSNIVVTSYSVLRTDVSLLESVLWDYITLDEGHLLKNPKTATAKASRRLKACHKLILTGTPIQNNVHEMWATFDFLMPNFLGTESSFLKEFAKPIVKSQATDASPADINHGLETLKILHQQVLPFVLRRDKSQVIKELPPKIVTDVPCSLSNQQHTMYKHILKKSGLKEALQMVDRSLAGTENQVADPQFGSDVLTSLLQLRLICTHPLLHSLFSAKKNNSSAIDISSSFTRLDCSGKLTTLNDLLRHAGIAEPEITAADNDESGFLVDMNESITDSSDIDCLADDSTDTFEDSQVANPPEAATNNSSKCLIFAQFVQSLDVVERLLFEPHMPSLQYLRLDGRVPSSQRSSIVDRFNQDINIKVLLLTTKVGGLGLNLSGADKVIFLEPDWNPFVDLQAMDRAHRIGQTKTVNVYRLITSDTIEEKMMNLQQRKKATSEAVVNAENSTMFSMGTDRLLDIFTCRGDSSMTTSSSSSRQPGQAGDDNMLSYLDDDNTNEYSSLSVDGFMRGLM